MTRRRRWVVFGVLGLVVAWAAGVFAWKRWWAWRAPEHWPSSAGEYEGPLTRSVARYDPSRGAPSRPWVDPTRAAPAPLKYRAYSASVLNGAQTDYLVYLPPGYEEPENAGRRYPVIYWFHGWRSAPEHGAVFAETLDAAVRAGRAPAMIAVLPNGLEDSWFVDSTDGRQPVESIVLRDLIPHVDGTYRTIASRAGRATEGFSMGGWAAVHLAVKHPDVFCAATVVSAPFHAAHSFPQLPPIFSGDGAAYSAEDPVVRLRREGAMLRGRIRLRMIAAEGDMHTHFMREVHERLKAWEFPHEFVSVPGVRVHADAPIYEKLGVGAFGFYGEVFGPK
ncbi:MAG TPA: alpha/beta hydrolase-fold protein [Tepidisphaeraceae bacterium]|nr:alpha/beta hydrolase-fold protein [Tepidisphaeraceae bacterium]